MEKKYKVFNRNKYDVGIMLQDNFKQQNVRAGSFASLSADDIAYLHSTSTAFSGKSLCVDDDEIKSDILGFTPGEKMSITEADITTMLKGTLVKIKKDFEAIVEPNFKYLIFETAKKMYDELSGGKIDYICEFCGRDSEDLKPIKEEIIKPKLGK